LILPRLRTCVSAAEVQRVVHEEFCRWFDVETAGPFERNPRHPMGRTVANVMTGELPNMPLQRIGSPQKHRRRIEAPAWGPPDR